MRTGELVLAWLLCFLIADVAPLYHTTQAETFHDGYSGLGVAFLVVAAVRVGRAWRMR